jgi:hypothetical protein
MLISKRNRASAQKDSLFISQYSSDAKLKKKQNKSRGSVVQISLLLLLKKTGNL